MAKKQTVVKAKAEAGKVKAQAQDVIKTAREHLQLNDETATTLRNVVSSLEVMRLLRRVLDVQHATELDALKADVEKWVKRN